MKKIILSALLVSFLTACGTNTVTPIDQINPPNVAPVGATATKPTPEKNMFETFTAFINLSTKPTEPSSLLMKVKGLTNTYVNDRTITPYEMFFPGNNSLSDAFGSIRLGKDGVLYLENNGSMQGEKQYFHVGTYKQTRFNNGDNVEFKLDQGNKLKMKWRGLNPMNHERIQIYTSQDLKPSPKPELL